MTEKEQDISFNFITANRIKRGDILVMEDYYMFEVAYIHPYSGLMTVRKYPYNLLQPGITFTLSRIDKVIDILRGNSKNDI